MKWTAFNVHINRASQSCLMNRFRFVEWCHYQNCHNRHCPYNHKSWCAFSGGNEYLSAITIAYLLCLIVICTWIICFMYDNFCKNFIKKKSLGIPARLQLMSIHYKKPPRCSVTLTQRPILVRRTLFSLTRYTAVFHPVHVNSIVQCQCAYLWHYVGLRLCRHKCNQVNRTHTAELIEKENYCHENYGWILASGRSRSI